MNRLIEKSIREHVTARDLAAATPADREAFFNWLSPANDAAARAVWNDWNSDKARRVFV